VTEDHTARVDAVVESISGRRPDDPVAAWSALGMDSLDLLTLITSVEDEFDVRISDPDAAALHSPADVVALVTRLREPTE
jgi:acyl carrier protein